MNTPRASWLQVAPIVFLALWSTGYPVAKVALQYAEPMTLLALRFGSVVVIMGVLFAVLRPPLPATPGDWGHLAVVGFLIQSVYFGLSYLAFRAGVAAGTAALIMSMQPVLVALVAPGATGEAISARRWLGLGLGLAGTAAVIIARSGVEAPSLVGLGLAAVALCGITAGSL